VNETVTVALAVGAVVLLVSAVALRVADRLGLPSLLLYLALGLVLGESALGIPFEDFELARTLGVAALVVILAEGGLTTRWSDVRRAIGPALTLSTVGVVVSIVSTAALTVWALGLDWRFALLLGAVVSSTDAAAVFATLRRLPLPRRMVAALEVESGLNDAPVILIVIVLAEELTGGHTTPWWLTAVLIGGELVGGAAIGLTTGFAGAWLLRRSALPRSGLYPLATLALCLLAYATSDLVHTSGFVAVYLCGLVLGNVPLPHRAASIGFAEGMATLAQIGLFVLLGLLVSPSRLGDAVGPALLVGGVLLYGVMQANRAEAHAFTHGQATTGELTFAGRETSTARGNGRPVEGPYVLRWRFEIDGHAYEGELSSKYASDLEHVPQDGRVVVLYDPDDPSKNTLWIA